MPRLRRRTLRLAGVFRLLGLQGRRRRRRGRGTASHPRRGGRRRVVRLPGRHGRLHRVPLGDAFRDDDLDDGSAGGSAREAHLDADARARAGARGHRKRTKDLASFSRASALGASEGGGGMPVIVDAADAGASASAAPGAVAAEGVVDEGGIASAVFFSAGGGAGMAIFPPANGLGAAAAGLVAPAGRFFPRFDALRSASASSAKYASRLRRASAAFSSSGGASTIATGRAGVRSARATRK